MRRIFVFLMLSGIAFGCKKDMEPSVDCSAKTNDMDKVNQLISGTYEWVYTTVRMMGSPTFTETPLTTGLNYRYVFKRNGSVDYYENNVLKATDHYVIDYEFKVSTFPPDSATIVIIQDKQTGQRKEFFRPLLCNDSARFYNPYNSIDRKRYFKRN